MSAPVKAILAGAAVVGIGGAGVWLLYSENMPAWRALVHDKEFWNGSGVHTDYSGKYGETYARLLVGAGSAKDDARVKDNGAWWDWAYKKLYKPNEAKAKRGFKGLVRGSKTSAGGDKSLQGACESAYRAEKTNVVTTDPNDSESQKFKEGNVWQFCSLAGGKPKSIQDMTGSNDQDKKNTDAGGSWHSKLGSKKKADLLAIYASDNEGMWKYLDIQFKGESNRASGFFTISKAEPTIKDLCAKAYGVTEAGNGGSSQPTEADLYKWCSLKGVKSTGSG